MDNLNKIVEEVTRKINENKLIDIKTLNDLKSEYLGKKSELSNVMQSMKDATIEQKKELGKIINDVKVALNNLFEEKKSKIEEHILNQKLENEKIDVTLPGINMNIGTMHPITMITKDVVGILENMGFDVVEGPEVEQTWFNFDALNVLEDHPARDMQDTFYVDNENLMRTQTSPVQIRTMCDNKEKTPIRIICPGKVYRKDEDDATHSHQFTQIEGLCVDTNITMTNLKGIIELLLKEIFGNERIIRFRPSFFPFTEPSSEVDISCHKCGGAGCNICKHTGFIEVLGCGMVNPKVLENCGYDSEKYSGFAFGIGVERIAMLKYGVNDIRDLYTNDVRFLNNFNRVKGGSYNEVK